VAESAGAAPSLPPRTTTSDLVVPLAVLTATGPNGPVGRTVGALVDDDGSSVVLMLPADRALAAAAAAAFRLSILCEDGEAVADDFAGGSSDFVPSRWDLDADSGPELRDAVATFACATTVVHPLPDGFLLVGGIGESASTPGRRPLVRVGDSYRRIEEPPLSVFPQFVGEAARERTSAR